MKRILSAGLSLVMLLLLLPLAAFSSSAATDWQTAEELSFGVYTDKFYCEVYEDTYWFTFTAPERGIWELKLNHEYATSSSYWRVEVYELDEDGYIEEEATVSDLVQAKEGAYTVPNYGCDKDQVFLVSVSAYMGLYGNLWAQVKVEFTPCDDWEIQPNGSFYNATAIPLDTTIHGTSYAYGDADWFSVSVPAAGTLTVKVGHSYRDNSDCWRFEFYKVDEDGIPEEMSSQYVWLSEKSTVFEEEVSKGTYCIKMVYSSGVSSEDIYTITPTFALQKPGGLTVTAPSTTSLNVKWSKLSDVTGYRVYNQTTGKYQDITGTSYTFTGLKAGNAYKIYVRAYKKVSGKTLWSNWTGPVNARTLPAMPTARIANAAGGVKVTWNTVTGASGYIVYRSIYAGGKWSGWKQLAKTSAAAYTDKTVSSGTAVKYTVRAYNAYGKSAYKASANLKYLAQPTPKSANATGGVKVTWGKSAGATGYIVYRSTASGGKWSGWKQIKVTTALSYTDKTVKSGATVKYTVRAYSGSYKSSYHAGSGTKYLAQPTVKAAKVSGGVKASWGKSAGATGYIVYRRQYSGGKWSGWKQIKVTTALSYTDKTAQKGVTYQYTARAYSGSYKSSYAASKSVKR